MLFGMLLKKQMHQNLIWTVNGVCVQLSRMQEKQQQECGISDCATLEPERGAVSVLQASWALN